MKSDLFFDSPAREIKEKLLANRFTAFLVEYPPKPDTAPENAVAAVRYDTTNLFSPFYFNSFALDLKAVVYETDERKGHVRLEADLKRAVKTVFYAVLIFAVLITVMMTVTGKETQEFGFWIPALILLFALIHRQLGKRLNFMRVKAKISRICSE